MAERKNCSLLRIILVAQLGVISGQRQITNRMQSFRLDTARVLAEHLFPFRAQGLRQDVLEACVGERNIFMMPELVLNAFQDYLTNAATI